MNAKLVLVSLLAILLCSCEKGGKDNLKNPDTKLQTFQLTVNDPMLSVDSGTADVEKITQVSVYLFKNNVFYQAERDITPDESGQIALSVIPDSKLYCLSGMAEPSSLSILEAGKTTLETFLALTTDIVERTSTKAPGFYSGAFALTDENKAETVHTIKMKRAVARFDLDSSRDPLIKITRIVLENAAPSTLLFAGATPISNTQGRTYEHTFEPAFSDGVMEDLFRTYESSSNPVKVTVYCSYKEIPMVVRLECPVIERNKIYKIAIQNVGAEISGAFEVGPWENGETVEGRPDVTEKITIDIGNSEIPDDVSVTDNRNEVKVPNSGTNMTLAFLAGAPVVIDNTDGLNSDTEITQLESISTPRGVVSKFNIAIRAQGKGRLPYDLILNMKSVLYSGIYDQVRISVAASDYQIEEVQLGGMTWMAFNARTRNLEDQTYVLDGSTVQELYEKNWLATIGGIFQWGRLWMHVPWAAGVDNPGGQHKDAPWRSDTHVPCPEGYRIPTPNELRALLPTGQAIPGTYTYNGEAITAELHISEVNFRTPNNLTGKARYISLTSDVTGQTLYIPLAGNKWDKSTTNNPDLGKGLCLWTDALGNTGGYAQWVIYWPGTDPTANVGSIFEFPADGYAYVRCLKK